MKSSTWVYNPWPEEDGKTGFFRNRRIIEEPNPLSVFLKRAFSLGVLTEVSGCENKFATYEETMDEIVRQGELHEIVVLTLFELRTLTQWHQIELQPKGRMTPRETWVVCSTIDLHEELDCD